MISSAVLSLTPYRALLVLFIGLNAGIIGMTFGTNLRAKQNPPAHAVAIPSYPDTASGRERIIADILRASKNGPAKYSAFVSSLSQPVPADWFRNIFGDDGDTMLRDYPDARSPRLQRPVHQ